MYVQLAIVVLISPNNFGLFQGNRVQCNLILPLGFLRCRLHQFQHKNGEVMYLGLVGADTCWVSVKDSRNPPSLGFQLRPVSFAVSSFCKVIFTF